MQLMTWHAYPISLENSTRIALSNMAVSRPHNAIDSTLVMLVAALHACGGHATAYQGADDWPLDASRPEPDAGGGTRDSASEPQIVADDAGGRLDSGARPDSSIDPEPVDREGVWAGTTSQGQPIVFDVVEGSLVRIEFGWQLPACQSSTETTFAVGVPIEGDHVERSLKAGAGGLSYSIAIDFGPADAAQGTLEFTLHPIPGIPSCSGSARVTFTAMRT